jgi:hypothetical protein
MTAPSGSSLTGSPVLLVLGAGGREHREFGLQRIASLHPVVLVGSETPDWARPHLVGEILVDLADGQAVATAVKEYATDHNVIGVLTYLDHYAELAARLAQEHGLPGHAPGAVAACRDKALTRRLLAQHAVPSARSYAAAREQDAVDSAGLIGFPVVIRPRAIAGSAAARRADSETEVRTAYRAATATAVLGLDEFPGVLIEEYLPGPTISVEAVVLGPGDIRIIAVTRTCLGPEPAFEEVGHCVDATDVLLREPAIRDATTRAVEALGITLGVVHAEMRLTDSGPRVIGVNACLGGDLIPLLVQLATGINLVRVAAALASGTAPDLTPSRAGAAAIGILYPYASGRVEELTLSSSEEPWLQTFEPWLERFAWTKQIGDLVSAPPASSAADRVAHWVVTGKDTAMCDERLQLTADTVVTRIATTPHTATSAR